MEIVYRAAVVTLSDKGAAGQRLDESGDKVEEILKTAGFKVVERRILPDERELIALTLKNICDQNLADLVVTTGGTGFAPRDCTPEATLDAAQRLAPGLSELMRLEGLKKTPRAALSRGVAAIREKSLILNLPGSPKGASENLKAVLSVLDHALELLTGRGAECAVPLDNH
ncbi:MAG: MogA/MoaB family molybdenum cofactor biosynthesis protein [Deltaproteobacteria bacterium]|jgi:molybdenum cofactor synthesis domain-containing protein|nr:MogA/MoaB family molybdenum cofactor biosynthesis protein [Deltaproteobacteria bacterium]